MRPKLTISTANIAVMAACVLLLAACGGPAPGGASVPAQASPGATSTSVQTETRMLPAGQAIPTLLPSEPAPEGASGEFKTDFGRHTVPYSEVLSGGPPKDGIPALDKPQFIGVSEADGWLKAKEPVILLQIGEDARAYPLQILTWHEIANDTVGGVSVVVSFCPLCNTAIVYERTIGGRALDFGTTGRLRYSNLIMYDHQTETWWQQATGGAIAGELAGQQLNFRPASIISWADFKAAYPGGKVLSKETGYNRNYGQNPYSGYDDVSQSPFLYRGPQTPGTLPPMARVLTVLLNGKAVAYPYETLQKVKVVNEIVENAPIAVFWQAGTASALDANLVAEGRDVGSATVFSRELNGQTLLFSTSGGHFVDDATGTKWDHLGRAIEGNLAGEQLAPVAAVNHFWFSWAAFRPDTTVYSPDGNR